MTRLGIAIGMMVVWTVAGLLACPVCAAYISPIAVVESSPISNPVNPPEHVIDGDPETTCNWLDDTSPRVDPETTGHLVVQLDQAYEIQVVRITPRQTYEPINPKGIDFFVFADDDPSNNASPLDDIEGDPDVILIEHHEFEPAGLDDPPQAFQFTTPFTATFVGLRITSTNTTFANTWQFTELEFDDQPIPEPVPLVLLAGALLSLLGRRWLRRS